MGTDVLVTGGTGLLGGALVRALLADPARRVAATWHRAPPTAGLAVAWEALDLAHGPAAGRLLARLSPRVLVHTAVTMRDEDLDSIIVEGSAALARAAHAAGAALVHVSSDMVFDGTRESFAEDAPLSPLTPYGAAKAEAERRVRAAHPEAYVVRASLLYGLDPPDRSLAAWLAGVEDGSAYPLFTDEIRCPAPVTDVAQALARLVGALLAAPGEPAPAERVLHLVGPRAIDRWNFGRLVLAALGKDPALARPARLADSGLVRPRSLVLTRRRTPAWLVEGIRSPEEALAPGSRPPAAPARAATPQGGRS